MEPSVVNFCLCSFAVLREEADVSPLCSQRGRASRSSRRRMGGMHRWTHTLQRCFSFSCSLYCIGQFLELRASRESFAEQGAAKGRAARRASQLANKSTAQLSIDIDPEYSQQFELQRPAPKGSVYAAASFSRNSFSTSPASLMRSCCILAASVSVT
jgi:hypothetical protein